MQKKVRLTALKDKRCIFGTDHYILVRTSLKIVPRIKTTKKVRKKGTPISHFIKPLGATYWPLGSYYLVILAVIVARTVRHESVLECPSYFKESL